MRKIKYLYSIVIFLVCILVVFNNTQAQNKRAMTYEDIMKFKTIRNPIISDDGRWAAYFTQPDRGDGEAIIQSTEDSIKYIIDRGVAPTFSNSSKWAFSTIRPSAIALENSEKGKDAPKNGLALLNLNSGNILKLENIKSYSVSEDSKWLAYKYYEKDNKKNSDNKSDIAYSDIAVRYLESGAEIVIQDVVEFAFDSLSNYLAYISYDSSGLRNGLYYINLIGNINFPTKITGEKGSRISNLCWNNKRDLLGFLSSQENKKSSLEECSLLFWYPVNNEIDTAVASYQSPKDWYIPFKNKMQWTADGKRIFFGFKPKNDTSDKETPIVYNDTNFYNVNTILKKTALDVWHWNDPRIKTHQKNWWQSNKDNTFSSVYNLETKSYLQLADEKIQFADYVDNEEYTIGYDDTPYMKEQTWEGYFKDLYKINLKNGARKLLATKLQENAYISPLGLFIVYYKDKNWFLHNTRFDSTENLTRQIPINFYNEDYDEPAPAPSYGFAGWLENDGAVLLYDKYDIWKFFTGGIGYLNQSGASGRASETTYRIYNLDPNQKFFKADDNAYISGFNNITKTQSLGRINFGVLGPEILIKEDNYVSLAAKAKNSETFLFQKQRYSLFPDLWTADSMFTAIKKISDVNPQMKDFIWGDAKLVEWTTPENDTLQGYVITPENLDPKKRYPMLVYFYDKFSDYLNIFYQPRINHRPCYQQYIGDGYIVFVPDIKYKTGNPGFSALNCLVSGVKKIVDMGLADSNAVGLQGHSWGGYQTAFVVTQTNKFAAAVAGAPVGNMTSAYSGIRLESGMARQFQYEEFQSRIGGNLWDSLDNYIRNSPVFQAEKLQTPLLFMFGDEDEAVPWQQGIELYLDLRRLDKNCIFLEYRNEPHHPRKYQNKLDYYIKMKEFYDHYLKKAPAPAWMIKGVEFRGK